MTDGNLAERCAQHVCCIRAPLVEASPGSAHPAGEWHLRWIPDDRTWFLVPPQGNVREIRITEDGDPTKELVLDGLALDGVRGAIERDALFPPC